ncbi:prolyl oligopeptidase family serine peptidase [Kitasatospora sp. NPDC056327]|uniref:prolyl oligopeptidase family serine peptidase n=1 Tax=Kitasatospora sp. NPDC056327 TaxID=3345785 RepID=UPI0035D5D6EC
MPQRDPAGRPEYPPALPGDTADEVGGRRVPDPYRALEDAADPATAEWSAGQRALFERLREGWSAVGPFHAALAALTAFDHLTSPQPARDLAFFTVRRADDEHSSLAVTEPGGALRILFDPQRHDPTGRTVLGGWAPDPAGRLVAHQSAEGGSEEYDLRVLDVATGRTVDGPIAGCPYGNVAWIPGHDAFYYSRRDPGGDGVRLHLHRLGEDPAGDVEVFGPASGLGEAAELDAVLGSDGRLLAVAAADGLSGGNRILLADLAAPGATWEKPDLVPLTAVDGGWSSPWPATDGLLYLLTDLDADRGRILVLDPRTPGPLRPRTLVPEHEREVLESFAVLDDPALPDPLLLVHRSAGGRGRITRHHLRTGAPLGEVPLPGAGVVTDLTFRQGGHEAWFTYSDPTTPETVHRHDARHGTTEVWGAAGAPRVPAVLVREVDCLSPDGTTVELLLTRPADRPHGPLPTILQGYGAFGEPQVADYYAAALAWAGHGGQFAVARVRGGGEHGEEWHRAGTREHKQCGIDDFLAAAGFLHERGLCPPDGLGAFGQSAGGLLVGAAMTQRPDLFSAVTATAAPLDMARYQLSGYGPYWTEEFGRREVPEELGWLLGYSPYHRVVPGTGYPAVLLAAAEDDARVDPSHSRKMCAALQRASASPRPVLLRQEAGVGHGDRARSGRLAYFADVLAFQAEYLGLSVQSGNALMILSENSSETLSGPFRCE